MTLWITILMLTSNVLCLEEVWDDYNVKEIDGDLEDDLDYFFDYEEIVMLSRKFNSTNRKKETGQRNVLDETFDYATGDLKLHDDYLYLDEMETIIPEAASSHVNWSVLIIVGVLFMITVITILILIILIIKNVRTKKEDGSTPDVAKDITGEIENEKV